MILDFNTMKNTMPFSDICFSNFGRQIIKTRKTSITPENIVDELGKALHIHQQNAIEINYLDRYYRGDQPILYRQKRVRPEVNNKVVLNFARFIVNVKTSELVGEPIQYVLHGTDEKKSVMIADLNKIMESEDKSCDDTELCEWRSICGTAYRFIGNDDGNGSLLDESPFSLSVEDPRDTFVVYYQNMKPAFSCQIREDEEGKTIYNCYTNSLFIMIQDGQIISTSLNGNGAIPVIEYPNNIRRLSDIEITIPITDELNKMASDRSNGIEQFVSSWVKFVNCAIDKELYAEMRQEGALVVKSNNGAENKADVDVISNELNQTESQVAVSDLFNNLLIIQGIANREGNTGGDTAGAVMLRDGFYTQEKTSELSEPIFIKSERSALRIILNRLRITQQFGLDISDVEVHISRTKRDNMQVKVQCLQMLLASGVKYERAIKTVGLFSDPEQVAIESKKRMELLYPEEEKEPIIQENVVETEGNTTEEITVEKTDKNKNGNNIEE